MSNINIKSWFPLSASSGLGADFALFRGADRHAGPCACSGKRLARLDLEAVRLLDEVRVVDLTLSRENLSQPANHVGFVR